MFKIIKPPLHLARYIECFWIGKFDNDLKTSFTHLAHARSKPQMLFHLDGKFEEVISSEKTFDACIYGQSSLYKLYKTHSKNPAILGIQLYPHAFPKLLSIPASDLTNESIDINSLFGKEGTELTEKIFTTDCDIQKVELVSRFLEKKFNRYERKKDIVIEHAIHHIHHHKGKVSVEKLVDQSFLSQRQFERSFKELAGFSPKSYLKIVRFESLLNYFTISPVALTDAALLFGYYDQAHLNHDFKAFTGVTPSQYLSLYSDQYK
jgi:AraC-like DNA-binding protein